MIIQIVFDAFDAPDSWHASLYLKALIQGVFAIDIHDYFSVFSHIHISLDFEAILKHCFHPFPASFQIHFNELSASIPLSNAPPYSDSLLLRGSLVLYAQLSSQSKLESSIAEALPNTSPMPLVTPRLK